MKNNYVLGLDIGIASVGWGIIDLDNSEIVDCGVRLFTEADAGNNATRRGKRSSRRLKSRKVTRKRDLENLLKVVGLYSENKDNITNPYEIRVKGLTEKLTNEELCVALFHICKRRGSSLDTIEDDSTKAVEAGKSKVVLNENDKLLKDKYVCEIQLDLLNKKEKVRGHQNNFRTTAYIQELEKLLKTQNIDSEIAQNIISIITRRREYYEGPGSEKSPTKYGRFYYENGELVQVDLIEKMRGRCTFYPEELRAPKQSYSAELFNFLNDLNNLRIDGESISYNQKQEAIQIINEKGSLTPKQLAKLLGVEEESIFGFRIDKNGKNLLTEFKGYKTIKKVIEEENSVLLKNKKLLDEISVILTSSKGITERKEKLISIASINQALASKLAELSGITGYHSLSLKAIYEINEEMINSPLNQMQIIKNPHKNKVSFKGKKKIEFDDSAILSPVAKQAQRQAIKVVNLLRKKYGEFNTIVVESTKSKNSAEQKAKITKNQKYFEERKINALKEIGGERKVNAKTLEKLTLYKEQDGKCLYSGLAIDIGLLLDDPYAYEIDHIIPISISLDDSINNKVLVTHSSNQAKGNLTPYMAFKNGKLTDISYKEFKSYILSQRGISNKKKEYLLFEEDITKFSIVKQFIARNLVDTSYANRVIFNTLSQYFKDNEIDTKIHTIRGSATSQFRKRIKIEKNRDEYKHHAIDALIVASLKKQPVIGKLLLHPGLQEDEMINSNTGEVVSIYSEDIYFDNQYIKFVKDLMTKDVKKFSYKVDKKANRQVSDETIYSTRIYDSKEYVIKKYKNIYESKFTTIAEDILNGTTDKYLMFKHDTKTFEKLIEIVKNYAPLCGMTGDEKKKLKENPFAKYFEEHGYITKYSKKDNGANIVSMKYEDGQLGNHINITKNYNVSDKKVVLLQISPYRTDFYITPEGKYKFITIRYDDVKYDSKNNQYYIEEELYLSKKNDSKKKITEQDEFLFSMHRNEIIEIFKSKEVMELVEKGISIEESQKSNEFKWKFTATNNDKTNKIEVKPIGRYEKERLMPTIGGEIKYLFKYHTDAIGNYYKIEQEELKLRW